MPRSKRLEIAQPNIEEYFNILPRKVFYEKDLRGHFEDNRQPWSLPKNLSGENFIADLLTFSKLREITLFSPNYDKTLKRYSWGANPSIYSVSLLMSLCRRYSSSFKCF
ncbi:MAG: hypothetical protein HYR81_00945 [Nitrospirae bacterium]|nr:hypothetical protein [Nitrospirota bacterium]